MKLGVRGLGKTGDGKFKLGEYDETLPCANAKQKISTT